MMPCLIRLAAVLLLCASALSAGLLCRECEGLFRRSSAELRKFKRQTGYPNGRKHYIIDHVIPLACAPTLGITKKDLDVTTNMQWQTKRAAVGKDRWERKHCRQLAADPRFKP